MIVAPITTEDELREQIEELEGRLSAMVSARDLTIRDLRAEVAHMRVQLGGLKGWCQRNGHDYALTLVLSALRDE